MASKHVKVDRALAQDQLDKLNEFYDVDTTYLVEAAKIAADQAQLSILKGITRGFVSIDQKSEDDIRVSIYMGGELKYTLEPFGPKAQRALDRSDVDYQFDMVGAMADVPPDELKELPDTHVKIVKALGNYFLYR